MNINKDQGEIYIITNIKNNKKYVGQTVSYHPSGKKAGAENRFKRHIESANKNKGCPLLTNSIKKNGKENFIFEVLIKCHKKDLDNYERTYIDLYNTLHPNGYNLDSGGKIGKKLHEETKKKIGFNNRFIQVSDTDKENIRKSMEEVGLIELPIGIHYNHNTKNEYEGFKVGYNYIQRSFIAKGRTLTEKLQQALEYLELVKSNDIEKIKEFDKKIEEEIIGLIKKSKNKKMDIKALEAMKNIGLKELPLSIRFEKRANRFYVATDVKKKNNYKYFTRNDPEKSLREALEFLNSRNGNQSEGLVNPMTA